jgi:outer membrane lipoprotein-sorting protein
MIVPRKRASAVVAVSVVLLAIASCRSQSDAPTTENRSSDTIVSSTPPFKTKEPERYRAVRTITTVNTAGETLVITTSVARDGEMRRHESGRTVYLDVPEGKFVLLPAEKVYADLTEGGTTEADKDDETLESSPDAMLRADVGNTSYQKMGAEIISGRNTNKYRIVVNTSAAANVSQSETLMWIDEALQMPVKSEMRSADGTRVTMELSEIKLEVDRKLFTIPEGFQKVKPSELHKLLNKT